MRGMENGAITFGKLAVSQQLNRELSYNLAIQLQRKEDVFSLGIIYIQEERKYISTQKLVYKYSKEPHSSLETKCGNNSNVHNG